MDERLVRREVDGAIPCRGLEQPVIEPAAAQPVEARFPAAVLLGDDRHVETPQRADVSGDEPGRPHALDYLPGVCASDRALCPPGVGRTRPGIPLLATRDFK